LLSTKKIIRTWWPLAFSWLLMGIEMPALSAIVARLANPEINLAAYSGIVFPLSLIIESPIIMLLSASTALSKDWASYVKIRRFMNTVSAAMTALHVLVAFTPLYDVIASQVLGVPAAILEPGRLGLRIMVPWTWSIAYRRFNQGVLIRFDRSRAVGIGTLVRLGANLLVLSIGYSLKAVPGIVIASSAVIAGVLSEAAFVGALVRPVLQNQLRHAPAIATPLTLRAFLEFYIPLALTSLLSLAVNPIGSAALSRMPLAIESLAAWSVVNGLGFMFRALGIAYNEVVVALLDQPQAALSLRRFAHGLAGLTTLLLLLMAATPFSRVWFQTVSGLSPELTSLAVRGLWLVLPTPALAVYQSLLQGTLLHGRQTRRITESVILYLITCVVLFIAGVAWQGMPGLYYALVVFAIAMAAQTAWMWVASRPLLAQSAAPQESAA
jgi:hypothetical protein